jgi:hypothetical protein
MRGSVGWDVIAVLLAAAAYAGCGDDAPGDDARFSDAGIVKAMTSSAAGTRGAGGAGRSAAGSGSSGTAGRPAPADRCSAAGWCNAPVLDERGCPSLDFAGILVLPSGCSSRGMCGIDASSVGGGGCVDLATAAERARLAGASAVFPAPRACDDIDAGVHDDAGM